MTVIYSCKARIRCGSVHSMASSPRQETSFIWWSWALAQAGQVRMACWSISGPVLQGGAGQVGVLAGPGGVGG